MGRKPINKPRSLNPGKREKYVTQLLPIFQEYGLNKHTIDELASLLGISKATFYHYFTSKEEMVSALLKYILSSIQGFEPILKDQSLTYPERYVNGLQLLTDHVSGISNIFLGDLKDGYPQHWLLVDQFTSYATEVLRQFYEEGIADGAFYPLNTTVLVLTDQIFLRTLSDPAELRAANLTLQEALESYFNMKCYGLLSNR